MKNYIERRQKVLKALPRASAMIIPSSDERLYSGEVYYPYRPHSQLLYLTGWEESEAGLLLVHYPDSTTKQILFVQENTDSKKLWTGPVAGSQKAGEITQVDLCYDISQFHEVAHKALKNISHLYYSLGEKLLWDTRLKKLFWALKSEQFLSPSLHETHRILAPLRMQKSPEEVENIKKACAISSVAHQAVMKQCQPGKTEGELWGVFLSACLKQGARHQAYPGIFASGSKAGILHYTRNDQVLKSGETLLVDAGCEYHYYASDISRTFPVNGRFSKKQKHIYKQLLAVQKKLIQILKPGLFLEDIHNQACEWLSQILLEEKIISGSLESVLKNKSYKRYFPHGVGHSLGLDVHDITLSPHDKKRIQLQEGFVLTIEPGLYFPEEDPQVSIELRGSGYRIEDDVLITGTGFEVLSHQTPKEVEELEQIVGSSK